MKKAFYIEIPSNYDLWCKLIEVSSYSHTCKMDGNKKVFFYDVSEHNLYKKLIPIFGTFGNIPKIKLV